MKNVIITGANGRSARQTIPRLLAQPDVRLTLYSRAAAGNSSTLPRPTGSMSREMLATTTH